ncbi:hypothetical protein JCM9803A_51460 [Rhodococcus erythropolis]
MKISRVFTAVLALLMTVAAGLIFGSGAAVASPKPTVVLVHGALPTRPVGTALPPTYARVAIASWRRTILYAGPLTTRP